MKDILVGIVGFMLLCAPLIQATGLKWDDVNEREMQIMPLGSLDVEITKPVKGYFYANNQQRFPFLFLTLLVGSITFEASISRGTVEKVEFFLDSDLRHTDYYEPFVWTCDDSALLRHTLKVKAYDYEGNNATATLPIWMFKGKESNTAPEPVIVEPAGNGLLFDPLWKTVIVSDDSTFIRAFESTNAEDIISASFEYSTDGITWTSVGIDTHGGFQGSFLSTEENQKIGDEGWGVRWDLSSLPEGMYIMRVTMTDEQGQTGQATKNIYYDPVPPTPLITAPGYGEVIQGITAFRVTTNADDVESMIVSLVNSSQVIKGTGWFNQSGLGNITQGSVGPNGADERNHFCSPTATANALAKQNNSRLYPSGQAGNNTMVARALAQNMSTSVNNGTTPWRSTGGPNCENETDNVGAGIRAYLEALGVGCSNDSGYEVTVYKTKMQYNSTSRQWYPVAGSNGISWEDYNNEIRKGESVILDIRPLNNGPDGIPGTPDDSLGGGHTLTGKGSNSYPNDDDTHSIGYVDPEDGQNHTATWSNTSGFSYLSYRGTWWLITGMWAVSSKQQTLLNGIGIDTDPTDGFCVYWNTTTIPNGYVTIVVDLKDSHEVIGREILVLEVDNMDVFPPHSWAEPESGPVSPDTSITIYATDEGGSGVAMIHYELWVEGVPEVVEDHIGDTVEFRFAEYDIFEGPVDMLYWARDNAGNTEIPNMTNYLLVP